MEVEEASVHRMEDLGLWKGVSGPQIKFEGMLRGHEDSLNDIERHATEAVRSSQLVLREGVFDLCHFALQNQTKVWVLSASWSGSWIAACLRELGLSASSYFAPGISVHSSDPMILVFANEIDPQGSGCLSRVATYNSSETFHDGDLSLTFNPQECGIWTGPEKARVLAALLRQLHRDSEKVIYIGDSLNDCSCFHTAEVKIHIVDQPPTADQQALIDTLRLLNVRTRPIGIGDIRESRRWDFWHTNDFVQIGRCLKDYIATH